MAIDWNTIGQSIERLGNTKMGGPAAVSGFGQRLQGLGEARKNRKWQTGEREAGQDWQSGEREATQLFNAGQATIERADAAFQKFQDRSLTRNLAEMDDETKKQMQADALAQQKELEGLERAWDEVKLQRTLSAQETLQYNEIVNQRYRWEELDKQWAAEFGETQRANLAGEAISGKEATARLGLVSAQLEEMGIDGKAGSAFAEILELPQIAQMLEGLDDDGYAVTRSLSDLTPEELEKVRGVFNKIVMTDYTNMSKDLLELFGLYAGAVYGAEVGGTPPDASLDPRKGQQFRVPEPSPAPVITPEQIEGLREREASPKTPEEKFETFNTRTDLSMEEEGVYSALKNLSESIGQTSGRGGVTRVNPDYTNAQNYMSSLAASGVLDFQKLLEMQDFIKRMKEKYRG